MQTKSCARCLLAVRLPIVDNNCQTEITFCSIQIESFIYRRSSWMCIKLPAIICHSFSCVCAGISFVVENSSVVLVDRLVTVVILSFVHIALGNFADLVKKWNQHLWLTKCSQKEPAHTAWKWTKWISFFKYRLNWLMFIKCVMISCYLICFFSRADRVAFWWIWPPTTKKCTRIFSTVWIKCMYSRCMADYKLTLIDHFLFVYCVNTDFEDLCDESEENATTSQ